MQRKRVPKIGTLFKFVLLKLPPDSVKNNQKGYNYC